MTDQVTSNSKFNTTYKKVSLFCENLIKTTNKSARETDNKIEIIGKLFSDFEKLTKQVSPKLAKTILKQTKIKNILPQVRQIRAEYEFQQEKMLALDFLLNDGLPEKFNYLIETEYAGSILYDHSFISRLRSVGRHCLVVGSGSLPITAFMLHKALKLKITCLDIEKESCYLSESIFEMFKLPHPVRHITEDIKNLKSFSNYNIIFVNGLVGTNRNSTNRSDKRKIISHIKKHLKDDCLLIMRTGYGLGQLFYPPIPADVLDISSCEVFHPEKLGRSSLVLYQHPSQLVKNQ